MLTVLSTLPIRGRQVLEAWGTSQTLVRAARAFLGHTAELTWGAGLIAMIFRGLRVSWLLSQPTPAAALAQLERRALVGAWPRPVASGRSVGLSAEGGALC